jgi:hypothetical protein
MIFMHELCSHLSHPLFQVDIENSSFAQVGKFEQEPIFSIFPIIVVFHVWVFCVDIFGKDIVFTSMFGEWIFNLEFVPKSGFPLHTLLHAKLGEKQ